MANRHLRKRTLEELIREIDDRISRLERRTSFTVGTGANAYVIETNAGGQLVSRHAVTSTTTVIGNP